MMIRPKLGGWMIQEIDNRSLRGKNDREPRALQIIVYSLKPCRFAPVLALKEICGKHCRRDTVKTRRMEIYGQHKGLVSGLALLYRVGSTVKGFVKKVNNLPLALCPVAHPRSHNHYRL
jgi:hypothetical protein